MDGKKAAAMRRNKNESRLESLKEKYPQGSWVRVTESENDDSLLRSFVEDMDVFNIFDRKIIGRVREVYKVGAYYSAEFKTRVEVFCFNSESRLEPAGEKVEYSVEYNFARESGEEDEDLPEGEAVEISVENIHPIETQEIRKKLLAVRGDPTFA